MTTLFDNRNWEKIYQDYQTGLSTRQLSKKYNISRPTIHKYFKQYGYKADHKRIYLFGEDSSNWKGGIHISRNRAFLRIGNKYIDRAKVVWEFYNGLVPEGFDIHHKNEDTLDDDIMNLELLSHSEHAKLHMTQSKIYLKSPTGIKSLEVEI